MAHGRARECAVSAVARPGLMKMWAVGSDGPNTLPPLKLKRARPSQKLSKLNAAPWKVGVLRGSTRRTPSLTGTGSATTVPMSGASARTPFTAARKFARPIGGMSTNCLNRLTPIEDITSLESLDRGVVLRPLWKGKSLAATSTFVVGELDGRGDLERQVAPVGAQ